MRFETLPRNSTLNMLVNLNTNGCSRLYSKVKGSNTHIIDSIVEKWSAVDIDSLSFSRSFSKHHVHYKDTYLKYLQFRTLHHRFYTNDKLLVMGLVQSDLLVCAKQRWILLNTCYLNASTQGPYGKMSLHALENWVCKTII